MKINETLMLCSLKYAKEILNNFGEKQKDGTYIFRRRKYTITNNSVNSVPI